MRVSATAPASTANLGPGFDCLGAALRLHVTVTVDTDGDGWSFVGEGPDPGPGLVRAALDAMGIPGEPGISVETHIPLERGLGSSAAVIAAALVAACALRGEEPDPTRLLEVGLPLEGHPDNLAPALFGGMTVVIGAKQVLRFDPDPRIRPVIAVPTERLSTAAAREVLPAEVPRQDAIANVARSSGLVALLTGRAEPTRGALLECTDDLLHQPYRTPLMPATAEAIRRLRDAGIAAAVSGAGPSIVCLTLGGGPDPVVEHLSEGWSAHELEWDAEGARVSDR